jgi:hypothetical protein
LNEDLKMTKTTDDEAEVLLIASRAGLEKAITQFREDVLSAAKAAANARGAYTPPDDPTAEPWPPMRVGGAS